MNLLLGFAIGAAFGAILQLGGASSYHKILGTLRLRDLTILKLILTAIAVGASGIALLDSAGLAHMNVKPTYVLGLTFSGLIFGTGFALSGYCPGTALVASSEGKIDALFTIAGGLVGTILFALVYESLSPLLDVLAMGDVTFPGLLGLPGWAVGVPLSAVLIYALIRWIPDFTESEERKDAVSPRDAVSPS